MGYHDFMYGFFGINTVDVQKHTIESFGFLYGLYMFVRSGVMKSGNYLINVFDHSSGDAGHTIRTKTKRSAEKACTLSISMK